MFIFLIQIRAIYPDNRSKVIAGKLSKCDCDRTNCPCEDLHPTVATSAFLHSPSAVAVDPNGMVYIADKVEEIFLQNQNFYIHAIVS